MGASCWCLAILLAAQLEDDSGFLSEVRQAVDKHRYQRIGILPRFIVRENGRDVPGGSLGPQADALADNLEDALVRASKDAKGAFRVIDGAQMRAAFDKADPSDLGKPDKLRTLAAAVGGLDALVVATVTDQRRQKNAAALSIRARLIDLRDGSIAASATEKGGVSLSDAAYMGESWELRRWSGGKLVNVGLDTSRESTSPFGQGPIYELMHYGMIRRDRPHPLQDDTFPYPASVSVDGQQRPVTRIGSEVWVALDPGDTYRVHLANRSDRDAYLALFVDGVSVLGKKRGHPSNAQVWYLPAGKTFQLTGWTTPKAETGKFDVEEFTITPGDDTVAAGQGFTERLGYITGVLFTVGRKDVPKAPDIYAAMALGSFGSGSGRKSEEKLEVKTDGEPPGPILAAFTIRYTTSARLEKLKPVP